MVDRRPYELLSTQWCWANNLSFSEGTLASPQEVEYFQRSLLRPSTCYGTTTLIFKVPPVRRKEDDVLVFAPAVLVYGGGGGISSSAIKSYTLASIKVLAGPATLPSTSSVTLIVGSPSPVFTFFFLCRFSLIILRTCVCIL